MPKCEKSSKQKSKQTGTGDYPNKGKLGDMGSDPRFYNKPTMNLAPTHIFIQLALAGNAQQIK